MPRLPFPLLALLLSPGTLGAQATLYTDPGNRFTVQVPEGWTTEDLGDPGLSMNGSGLAWTISPLTGLNANEALTNMVDRVSGSWKNLREIDRQSRSIAGQTATWIIFEGNSRDGKPGTVRALGMQGGGVTAGVIISGEHTAYMAGRGTIEAVLATLRLGTNSPIAIRSSPTVEDDSTVEGDSTGEVDSVGSNTQPPLLAPVPAESPPVSIGLVVRDIDDEDVRLLDLDDESGALVDEVQSGGPADQAGIRKGVVILQVDRTVVTDAADFERMLGEHKPGDTVELQVTRNGRNKTVSVRVDRAP